MIASVASLKLMLVHVLVSSAIRFIIVFLYLNICSIFTLCNILFPACSTFTNCLDCGDYNVNNVVDVGDCDYCAPGYILNDIGDQCLSEYFSYCYMP